MTDFARQRWMGFRDDLGYLLWIVPSILLTFVLFGLVLTATFSIALAGVGVIVLPWTLTVLRRWTDLHRRLAGRILHSPIPLRYNRLHGGIGARFRQTLLDRTTWRDLGWAIVHTLIGIPIGTFALLVAGGPLIGLVSMFFWWVPDQPINLLTGIPLDSWVSAIALGLGNVVLVVGVGLLAVTPIAHRHALLTRLMLGRSATHQLADRVEELTQTRAGVIDAHGAELSRIERDLHDGTQARLVSIAMRLGIARQAMTDDPEGAATLIQDAQNGAEDAMRELRAIIRTMYPPVLADLGLEGALHALAAGSPVPVHVEVDDLGSPPAAVEAAAYYAIAEALTNVAKHSAANHATVSVWPADGWLHTVISDDGRGGVDETRGTGVTGIRRRVAALDGVVHVVGPTGGPTEIKVQLPCGS